jgi:tRNA(fMet)-specific endonuclease VapC
VVDRLLSELEVLPWRSEEARTFASLRAELESLGRVLAPLDLLIAAHAITVDAVLISDDRVFEQVPHLRVENWLAG